MKVFIRRPSSKETEAKEENKKQNVALKSSLYLIFAEDENTKDKKKQVKEIIDFASQ